MNLPRNRPLKSITYTFEDGTKFSTTTPEDANNMEENLRSLDGFIASRTYITMKPVNWSLHKSFCQRFFQKWFT